MPWSGGGIWYRDVDGPEAGGGGGIWWSAAADEAPRDKGGANRLVMEVGGASVCLCFERAEHCMMYVSMGDTKGSRSSVTMLLSCLPIMFPYISAIVGGAFAAVARSSVAVSKRVPRTRFVSSTSLGALLVLGAGLLGGARFFFWALLR